MLILILMLSAALLNAADLAPLDGFVLERLKASNTPGAAVAVVQDGRVVYARGFGVADVETKAPVTPDHLFRIGSTTKMITAAAVLTLVEEGRVALDKPIGTYVTGLDPRIASVTLHQLLTHTAGLADQGAMFGLHDDTALLNGARELKPQLQMMPAGRLISYSNPGYWLAGLVLQEVSGKPFADAVAERILKPLGMVRSTFRPLVAMTYPMAQQHDQESGTGFGVVRPMADNTATWPAGSLYSSANELARWMVAFLDGGKSGGKQVLPPALIERMSTGQAEIPGSANRYAYGLVVSRERGPLTLSHGGSRVGYGSTMTMVPEQRVGVVVLGNRSGSGLPEVAERALELVLDWKPRPEASKAEPLRLPEAELSRYVGTYARGEQRVRLTADGGRLVMSAGGKAAPVETVGRQLRGLMTFSAVPGEDGRIAFLHSGLRAFVRVTD